MMKITRRPQMMLYQASLIALLVLPMTVFGANSNVGTSGAAFLRLGAGARPTAMGNAFVGVADDVNAVYFNPAGLSRLQRPELTAMHTQYFQGINYDFGAFVYPTDVGAFAVSAATLEIDDLEKRNTEEAYQGRFKSLDGAYAVSYARNIGDLTSLGLTGRYIKQEIDDASASSFSGDVGVYQRLIRFPVTIGAAVRHLGPKIKFREEGDPQPMTVDVGLGTALLSERLRIGINMARPRDNDLQFGLGTEFTQTVTTETRFSLRAGYTSVGTDADGTTGISLGGGFGFRQLNLDVSWVPFGDLGETFRYAALFRF